MFVTFSRRERPEPESGWQRIRQRVSELLHPPQTSMERIALCGSFFIDIRIGAQLCADEQQQRRLRQCGRLALCAGEFPMPEGFLPAVSPADIRRMLAHILCNTADELLQISALPLYCRCVALVDLPCAYGALLERLVKFTPELLVYTENRQLYEGYAEQLMDRYGAPVQFVQDPQALTRACLILDTCGSPLPPLRPALILSIFPDGPEDGNLRLSRPLWKPGEADSVLPPGIDRYAFFAALYERCGIREIYQLSATALHCKGRQVGIQEVSDQLRRSQSKALLVR